MVTSVPVIANDGATYILANGGETTLAFDFLIYFATHIKFVRNRGGVLATGVLNTDFSVPGGSLAQSLGGTINLLGTWTPAVAGDRYALLLNVPAERLTDYNNAGDFFADALNLDLDLGAQRDQMSNRNLAKAIKVSDAEDESAVNLVVPLVATRASKLQAFDALGNVIVSNLTLTQMESGSTDATAQAVIATTQAGISTAQAGISTAQAAIATAAAAAAVPNANYTATATGTNGYTINTGIAARLNGQRFLVYFTNVNSNTNVTLTDGALTAKSIRVKNPSGTQAAGVGELIGFVMLVWDTTNDVYLVVGPRHPFNKMLDVASAATTDFTQSTGDYCQLTGAVNITAMTLAGGDSKTVAYVGAGLSITLGASLTLNGLASGTLPLQTGDIIVLRRDLTVTKIVGGTRASGRPLSITGGEASVASAGTTDLGAVISKLISITGTTGITSFGSSATALDPLYFIQFAGALTLTHNATSLILPGAANITTVAGDSATMKYEGGGNWRMLAYNRASGAALVVTNVGPTIMAIRSPGAVLTDQQTGIPAGVKRVKINFFGLSKAGTGDLNIQIGPSGGVATSGYVGVARGANVTAGMAAGTSWTALGTTGGCVELNLVDAATNKWSWHGTPSGGGFNVSMGGYVTLSGALERVLITDQGGSPGNFSGGSWGVTYD